MATAQENQRQEKIAETKRELRRRSLDQIAVYNPLSEPFRTTYDGFTHQAPPQSESIFPRYIAEKWIKEFIDYMINEDERTAVERENEKRESQGHQPLDAQEREKFAMNNNLLTSNEDLRYKYMKQVYRGVRKEYGQDYTPEQPREMDKRPADTKLLERLDEEMGTEFPDHEEELEEMNVEDKKEELMEEIDD